MNMHATVEHQTAQNDVIHSIAELLTVALHLLDELDLPPEIGAHLDLTIHKLAGVLGSQAPLIPVTAFD